MNKKGNTLTLVSVIVIIIVIIIVLMSYKTKEEFSANSRESYPEYNVAGYTKLTNYDDDVKCAENKRSIIKKRINVYLSECALICNKSPHCTMFNYMKTGPNDRNGRCTILKSNNCKHAKLRNKFNVVSYKKDDMEGPTPFPTISKLNSDM